MARALAVWISRIFHPFVVPIPTLVAALRLSGASWGDTGWWTALCMGMVIAPTTAWLVALLVALVAGGAPRFLLACLVGGLAAMALGALVSGGCTALALRAFSA